MNDFDKKIKDLVDAVETPVEMDMWVRVEGKLDRKERWSILRKISCFSAAAVVGALLIVPSLLDKDHNENLSAEIAIEEPKIIEELKIIEEPKIVEEYTENYEIKGVMLATNEELVLGKDKEEVPSDEEEKSKKDEPAKKVSVSVLDQIDGLGVMTAEKISRRRVILGVNSNVRGPSEDGNISSPSFAPGMDDLLNSEHISPKSDYENIMPLTVGLSLQIPVTDRFGIMTGLNYTLLRSKYEAVINNDYQANVSQSLHYLGVPVSLYYDVISSRLFRFYVSGGVLLEKGLQIEYHIAELGGGESVRSSSVDGIQWSTALSMGVEYRFIKSMGIYLAPNLTYYFDNNQPMTSRTQQPLQIGLELGLRFSL